MMNQIGKGLVLLNVGLCVVLMVWATFIYLQFDDTGWKEPMKVWETKDTGYRVPSKLDKRIVALHQLYRDKERDLPGIKPAIDALRDAMERFPKNHLFYAATLEEIRNKDGDIAPKALTWENGELALEAKNKQGKPAMTAPITGIDKSIKTYNQQLKDILKEISDIMPVNRDLSEKCDAITAQLLGTKEKGATVNIGLYEILENEKTHQDKIAAEKDQVIPLYVDAQRRVEGYQDRRRGMERTLVPFEKEPRTK